MHPFNTAVSVAKHNKGSIAWHRNKNDGLDCRFWTYRSLRSVALSFFINKTINGLKFSKTKNEVKEQPNTAPTTSIELVSSRFFVLN